MHYVVRTISLVFILIFAHNLVIAQEGQASLLLDLKKARAAYEIAKNIHQNNKELLSNKAISEAEYNQSKNELLSKEVDCQKLMLRLISQQSYVIVEKAIKYQNKSGKRRVKVILRSTMEGNQEYLNQFKEQFDVFSPEMQSNKIYNTFVSLVNIENQTIIGSPYEIRIPVINMGHTAIADFELLKDVESIQISLNYINKKDIKKILLEKDSSTNKVDVLTSQFSQETDLGASANYDLALERFTSSDEIYQLVVLNLPKQISADFIDYESNARLSQLKFNQGVNLRNLRLKVFLPDREDNDVKIEKPIKFYALVATKDEFLTLGDVKNKVFSDAEIRTLRGGLVKLEIIPSGIGDIELLTQSLYYKITSGDSIVMNVKIRNGGTRSLNNIKIETDYPLNWSTSIEPNLVRNLDPEEEESVTIVINPSKHVGVGAQEVKLSVNAKAGNMRIKTEDKIVRVQIEAKKPLVLIIFLVFLFLGAILGIAIFTVKISKK